MYRCCYWTLTVTWQLPNVATLIQWKFSLGRQSNASHEHTESTPSFTAAHDASSKLPQHRPAKGVKLGMAVLQQCPDALAGIWLAHSQCIGSTTPEGQSAAFGVSKGQAQRQSLLWICPGPAHELGHSQSQSLSTLFNAAQSFSDGAHIGHTHWKVSGFNVAPTSLHSFWDVAKNDKVTWFVSEVPSFWIVSKLVTHVLFSWKYCWKNFLVLLT